MSHGALTRRTVVGCLVLAFVIAFPGLVRAGSGGGFDLFDPLMGSQIFVPALGRPVFVVGVPIVSFPDFGNVPLGDTNSILQLQNPVSESGPFLTPVQMVAMQMMSTDGSNLFFTLQTGVSSAGTLSGQFDPVSDSGTFNWNIDLFLEAKTGSFTGPLFTSFDVDIIAGPSPWSHVAPPGAVCLPAINCFLNGTNSTDFFPTEPFTSTATDGTSIIFGTATAVPEPGTITLVIAGLAAMAFRLRRSHRRENRDGATNHPADFRRWS
jgi:hypothetical protein